MSHNTVTSQMVRKSLATLLREWAAANGREYSARCDESTGGLLRYFIDGHQLARDTLMRVMETGEVDIPAKFFTCEGCGALPGEDCFPNCLPDADSDRYWTCDLDPECGTIIEGRSIVTCASCWTEAASGDHDVKA